MSTMKDVANLAGVSISTVSRVLSGDNPSAASKKTTARIWDAVRTLEYSINETASNLRKPKPVIDEKVIDCILARELLFFSDPFLSSLRHVIEECLFKKGYRLRGQIGVSELNNLDSIGDAAIILGRVDSNVLKVLKKSYKHLIYTGLQEMDLNIDSVICRGYDSVCAAMDYLASLGHKRICYLGETSREERYVAYLDMVKKLRLADDKSLVVDVLFTPGDSYSGLKKALSKGLDCSAIICANDASYFGVLKAVKEFHKSIPEDISVIGINDMEDIRYLDPMLTSMSIPVEDMGNLVVQLLISRINQLHSVPAKVYIPSRLTVRDSCIEFRGRSGKHAPSNTD